MTFISIFLLDYCHQYCNQLLIDRKINDQLLSFIFRSFRKVSTISVFFSNLNSYFYSVFFSEKISGFVKNSEKISGINLSGNIINQNYDEIAFVGFFIFIEILINY